MWFLVAALFVASVAYNAYASRKAASKVGKPGPLEPPRAPAGTPIRVFFGTVKVEPTIVAFKVDKIAKYMKASGFLGTQEQFLGWTHTVSYIALLGWGGVSHWRDLLFDETKLLSDEVVNPRVATLTVDGVGGYYTYTSQGRGTIGEGHKELYLPNVFGGKPPQGQGQLASGRNDWIGTPHKGGDFFFMPGYGGATATFAYPQPALDTLVNAYAGATEPFSFAAQPKYPRFALMALDWVNLGLADSLHKIEVICSKDTATSDGYDASPTGVILQILTNLEWGLGIPAALIDTTSFSNVGVSLGSLSEDFGISCVLAEQKPAEDYIGEILKTIDAALYRAPDTGKLAIQLIRGGYTVASLPALNETNVRECEWSRRDIADTVNQVTITFTDRNWMFESNSVTLTDHANVAATGGIRAVTLDFPFVSNEARAVVIGARELKERTIPLGTGTLVVDRETWDAVPGDLFRLSWARYGLSDVAIRVLSVNPGTLEDGALEIEVSQDAYGFPDVPYVVTEDPPSTPTTATPTPDVPTVTERTAQDATTGTLTLLVLDEGARVTSVEFSTQTGSDPASAYSADGSVPYTATVALDSVFPSYIYWRVLWTDDDAVSQTIFGTVTFTAIATATTSGALLTDDGVLITDETTGDTVYQG